MKRWNGWGETDIDYPLAPDALGFLSERIGTPKPTQDASLEDALKQVPASRCEGSFDASAKSRLLHARAQSYADWIAMRSGQFGPFPDAVAFPTTHAEATNALETARRLGAIVIPYGGGTSVAGHLAADSKGPPVVSISLERMNKLLSFDDTTLIARFGAGTPGPQVEAQLAPHGALLGHFPQSYDYSTVGGWVVTRSSGQQSLRYGRIEQMFHQGLLATPKGEFNVGGLPASAAGPDLREVVLGSEGRLGLLTEVSVRVRRLPQRELFHAVFFPSWEAGATAMRLLAQADVNLSMLRLSNELETTTQLALAGHASLIRWLERYLRLRGVGEGKVMLLLGATGTTAQVRRALGDAFSICKGQRGVHAGARPGAGWVKNRFRSAYIRNSLWEAGFGVDTMETCMDWHRATPYMRAVEKAAADVFAAEGERIHGYTHLSHVYRSGCSVYSTFVWRLTGDPARELARWQKFKRAVSETIVKFGGTISHQHGVGADHAPYLPAEKGPLGMSLIRAMAREFDPAGQMNPGKLFV